jgi:putative ABC transport system substrate-binding protein
MIPRRHFLGLLAVSLVPLAGRAQPAGEKRRVAVVTIGSLARQPLASLVEGLRELGHVEGRNLEFIPPDQKGSYARLAEMARNAVERKSDVIVSFGTSATAAATKATSTIPIVMVVGADPVALGFVRNLARPEANVTGLATGIQILATKRLELLKEIVPGMRRIAVLWNPASTGQAASLRLVEQAAKQLGASVQAIEIRSAADIEGASAALSRAKPDALLALPASMLPELGSRIVQLAAAQKLPAAYAGVPIVREGGLMAYTTDEKAQLRRAAYYVDRILKGAKPGDLPIEQPTKFELVLNMKTAKKLGLKISRDFLARVDEVIQ